MPRQLIRVRINRLHIDLDIDPAVFDFIADKFIAPVKDLNPPSCFPVTFEPVKAILEFSGLTGRETAPAVRLAGAAFEELFDGAEVCALNLFAAGSSQATRNNENDNITNKTFDIERTDSFI